MPSNNHKWRAKEWNYIFDFIVINIVTDFFSIKFFYDEEKLNFNVINFHSFSHLLPIFFFFNQYLEKKVVILWNKISIRPVEAKANQSKREIIPIGKNNTFYLFFELHVDMTDCRVSIHNDIIVLIHKLNHAKTQKKKKDNFF